MAASTTPGADGVGEVVLALADVCVRRGTREILRHVDLSVRAGQQWALLGPNGAGKTTILNLCGALTHPTSGTVDVLGERIGRVELQALRRTIGHVDPRHAPLSAKSVRSVVLSGLTGSVETPPRWEPTAEQGARAEELIEMFGLAGRTDACWPSLSQGERGRTLIARALITDPRLLLLDEPSTGLDMAAREQLLETIASLTASHPRLATLTVTHHLEELAETTTHALLVAGGQVLAVGEVDQVITTPMISRAFAHPIAVTHHQGRWSARRDHTRPARC